MRVIAESTEQLARVNGQLCRVWNATSEGGVECYLFVAFLSANASDDNLAVEAAQTPLTEERFSIHLEDILGGG